VLLFRTTIFCPHVQERGEENHPDSAAVACRGVAIPRLRARAGRPPGPRRLQYNRELSPFVSRSTPSPLVSRSTPSPFVPGASCPERAGPFLKVYSEYVPSLFESSDHGHEPLYGLSFRFQVVSVSSIER
jgi:hypothetical protein